MSSSSTTSSTNAAERSGASADTSRPAQFAPTHWSVVLAAADGDSPKAAAALAQLCRDYWYPLYAFVRRKGFSPPEAQDLTQDFFARLLEKDLIKAADPARGKFRSFLSASMQNFLNNEWARRRTEKRGGKAAFLSLDDSTAEDRYQLEAVSDVTPEKTFERRWALTLLDKALGRLKAEYAAEGKRAQFEALQIHLSGEKTPTAYAEAAARLKMTEGAVRVAVYRLRRRMGELVRAEILQTVAEPKDVEEEVRQLFKALGE